MASRESIEIRTDKLKRFSVQFHRTISGKLDWYGRAEINISDGVLSVKVDGCKTFDEAAQKLKDKLIDAYVKIEKLES